LNRKIHSSIAIAIASILAFTTAAFFVGCGSSSMPPTATIAIAAQSGGYITPQPVGNPFGTFSVLVNSNGSPLGGASVTFTAPSTADGTFMSNGTASETQTTGSNGIATSSTFTAGTTVGSYNVTATTSGAATPATLALTNNVKPPPTIAPTPASEYVTVSTTYAALTATVTDTDGNPVPDVQVTFTANTGAIGATGTFTSTGTNIEIQTTGANGKAVTTDLVANATAGGFTVTASSGTLTPATFHLTNTAVGTTVTTYVFYASGEETINANYYAVAGAVSIEANGTVVTGEEDYNDAAGLTSGGGKGTPDSITGGMLTVDHTTGQGTLSLTMAAGSAVAAETFGVQFVNVNHALIMEYDGNATSSGSLDLQTSGSTGSGASFAFTLSGVDPEYDSVAFGGVYTITGAGGAKGTVDANDSATVVTGTVFSISTSAPDFFGRSVWTGFTNPVSATAVTFASYGVGPEVLRIIDVDAHASVFGVAGDLLASQYAAAGQFTTSNTTTDPAGFSGTADDNELDSAVQSLDASISGTYSLESTGINGYGNFTIGSGNLGHVQTLQIYMVDPNLNINDPNNTTSDLGGALFLDTDPILASGIGVVTPQTDARTAVADFNGNYAVGWQNFNSFSSNTSLDYLEFDMLAQGTMTSGGALSLTKGLVSDPLETLGSGVTTTTGSFTGTPLVDPANPGRYTMSKSNTTPNPFSATIGGATRIFDLSIYQASGAQLYWIETDKDGVFLGSIEQQKSLTGLPEARGPRPSGPTWTPTANKSTSGTHGLREGTASH
jgi:hypothetical protein